MGRISCDTALVLSMTKIFSPPSILYAGSALSMTMGMARLSNPVQRPGKIREDILGIFDADGKTDEIFGYARFFQIGGGKLAMGGGSGVEYAAPHVRDVCFLRDKLQGLHETCAVFRVPFYPEAQHAARARGHIFFRQGEVIIPSE